ncbi:hypothetical protein GQ457_01G028020 [Hibiscus cannabinus]
MVDFSAQIKEICDLLAACGSPISEIEQVAIVLNGLPSEFEPFVAVITASKEPYTFDVAMSLLVDAEMRLNDSLRFPIGINNTEGRFVGKKSAEEVHSGSPRFYSCRRGDKGYNSGRYKRRSRPQCQLCGKIGHLIDLCWYRFDHNYKPNQSRNEAQANSCYCNYESCDVYSPFVPEVIPINSAGGQNSTPVNQDAGRVFVSRHVVFDEGVFPATITSSASPHVVASSKFHSFPLTITNNASQITKPISESTGTLADDTCRVATAPVFEDDAGLNPPSVELNEPMVETGFDESSGPVAEADDAEPRNTEVDGEASGNPKVDSEELCNSTFETSGSPVQSPEVDSEEPGNPAFETGGSLVQSLPSVSQGVETINTCDQFALSDVVERNTRYKIGEGKDVVAFQEGAAMTKYCSIGALEDKCIKRQKCSPHPTRESLEPVVSISCEGIFIFRHQDAKHFWAQ